VGEFLSFKTFDPDDGSARWFRFLIVSLLALHLSWGLRVPRVGHPDELWTLRAIQGSYGQLITHILDHDNHPPLYYILIKGWTFIAGGGIGSIRVLSYLFGLLTLLLFAVFYFRSRPIGFLAPLLVLATNPLFTYFSATIRPYAFMVFLASGAILSSMALRSRTSDQVGLKSLDGLEIGRLGLQMLFYGSCFLLGLTHYYGLLYAMILLAWDLIERRISSSRLPTIMVAGMLIVWPLLQVRFGSLDNQLESNAWVNVVPVVSTLNNFLMGQFPAVVVSRTPAYLFSLGLLLCLGSILFAHRLKLQSLGWSRFVSFLRHDMGYLVTSLVLVFAASLVADLFVPFTTPYYFLVGLPAIALLFGFWVQRMHERFNPLPAALFVAAVVLTQVVLTHQQFMAT
jgi:hypothetical protein